LAQANVCGLVTKVPGTCAWHLPDVLRPRRSGVVSEQVAQPTT